MGLLKNLAIRHTGKNVSKAVKINNVVDDRSGLVDRIVVQDRSENVDRVDDVIDGGLLHSTAIEDVCVRYVAICRKTKSKTKMNEIVDSNMKLIWAMGRSMEEHIRGQLLKEFPEDAVIGDITCKCGSEVKSISWDGLKNPAEKFCNICNTSVSTYREKPLVLNEFGTIHSPDMGYFNHQNKGVVIEIKSIKKEDFEKLKVASMAHITQAYFYHYAAEVNGGNMANYVKILYGSKGFILPKNGYPYKEFTVKITDHPLVYKKNVDMLIKGKIIKMMDSNGVVPEEYRTQDGLPDGLSDTPEDSKFCKNCDKKSLCVAFRDRA